MSVSPPYDSACKSCCACHDAPGCCVDATDAEWTFYDGMDTMMNQGCGHLHANKHMCAFTTMGDVIGGYGQQISACDACGCACGQEHGCCRSDESFEMYDDTGMLQTCDYLEMNRDKCRAPRIFSVFGSAL